MAQYILKIRTLLFLFKYV